MYIRVKAMYYGEKNKIICFLKDIIAKRNYIFIILILALRVCKTK